MGAVIKFIGVFSTAAAIGVTLKSLDGFFEWTDTRRAAKLEASEMKQAIYLEKNRLLKEMRGTH